MEYTAQVTTCNVDAVSIDSLHLLLPDDVDLEIDLPTGSWSSTTRTSTTGWTRPGARGRAALHRARELRRQGLRAPHLLHPAGEQRQLLFNNTDLVPYRLLQPRRGTERPQRPAQARPSAHERMTPLSEDPATPAAYLPDGQQRLGGRAHAHQHRRRPISLSHPGPCGNNGPRMGATTSSTRWTTPRRNFPERPLRGGREQWTRREVAPRGRGGVLPPRAR